MEILIRPWQEGDIAAVRRILWESWSATYRAFVPEADLRHYFAATYGAESLARLHACGHVHGCIGLADGEAVGYARTQFHAPENRLYLASLYLLPTHQGKGVGGRLLRAAEERALAYGLRQLWVGVMVQNEAARRWYEGRGFRFLREEPFRIGRTTVPHLIGCKADLRRGAAKGTAARSAAIFPGPAGTDPLAALAADLYERQQAVWPQLAAAAADLEVVRTREIRSETPRILVQFNPRRIVSATAVHAAPALRQTPCFLCLENLPPEQLGILYRRDTLVLCNPAPIFPNHYTLVHRTHRPQAIEGRIALFLRFAEDFGPGTTLLYNGARCGASAPDHLHFQALPAGLLPVEKEILDPRNLAQARRWKGVQIARTAGLGRAMVLLTGRRREAAATALRALIGALRRLNPAPGEPMFNLLGMYGEAGWRLILFPRRRHRPLAYFREGAARRLISVGAVEMGGCFITPREEDFRALDGADVAEIYGDVAWTDAEAQSLLEAL